MTPNCVKVSPARQTRRARALATTGSFSKNTSRSRATSKSRCSATRTATSCIWAIEARVYAEDPLRNFLPSIGRLVRYRPPVPEAAGEGVRVDSGVFEGAEISLYYDPMIAKLIVHGADRDSAIERLRKALDGFYIAGPRHNLAALAAIAASERFREGRLSTDF